MKLPGIGNIRTTLSSRAETVWKELQKNSSVAAQKSQNFIFENIRPLSASKDAKARWSISSGQKPGNRPVSPKNNNYDFNKLVSNVWISKFSKLSSKKIGTFEERAKDLYAQLNDMDIATRKSYTEALDRTRSCDPDKQKMLVAKARAIYNKNYNSVQYLKKEVQDIANRYKSSHQQGKNQNWNARESNSRMGQLNAKLTSFPNVYSSVSTRKRLGFHESLTQKLKSSGNGYDNNMKKLDNIQSEMQSLRKKMEEEMNNLDK